MNVCVCFSLASILNSANPSASTINATSYTLFDYNGTEVVMTELTGTQ